MMDTLKRLVEFYGKDDSKSIVWAHNTHIGDARQTDMADAKMINIGQLVREYATEMKVMLVGFVPEQRNGNRAEWLYDRSLPFKSLRCL
jgi:erythromycin esterase